MRSFPRLSVIKTIQRLHGDKRELGAAGQQVIRDVPAPATIYLRSYHQRVRKDPVDSSIEICEQQPAQLKKRFIDNIWVTQSSSQIPTIPNNRAHLYRNYFRTLIRDARHRRRPGPGSLCCHLHRPMKRLSRNVDQFPGSGDQNPFSGNASRGLVTHVSGASVQALFRRALSPAAASFSCSGQSV
jgi:hypothetical protein